MCFCSALRLASSPPIASWWRCRASRSSASALPRSSRVASSALVRASDSSLSASRRASATWSSAVRWAIMSTRSACCSPSPLMTGPPCERACSSSDCIARAACSAADLSRLSRSSWALSSAFSWASRGSRPPPTGPTGRPPRSAAARSSLFSSIRRASSRSTSSRKASTSSSSYPRLPIGGFLKATLWTSAGVSGIGTPRVQVRPQGEHATGAGGTRSHERPHHDLHQHVQDKQQHNGRQVNGHRTKRKWWDHTPQRLEGRIGDAPHRFQCRGRSPAGVPTPPEGEDPTHHEPAQKHQPEEVQEQVGGLGNDRYHHVRGSSGQLWLKNPPSAILALSSAVT